MSHEYRNIYFYLHSNFLPFMVLKFIFATVGASKLNLPAINDYALYLNAMQFHATSFF